MTADRLRWTLRSFMPVAAPAVLGVAVWFLGHPMRATILWVVAGGMLVPVVAGVPIERYIARLGGVVAHVVGLVATGIIGMLLVVAGGIVRAVGGDPLIRRSARVPGWQPAATASAERELATSSFGIEPGRSPTDAVHRGLTGRVGRTVLVAVGTVLVVLFLDLLVGLSWEALKRDDGVSGEIVDAVNFTGNRTTRHDIRADLPAMAAYPWADAYFRETQLTPGSYWPFTESRPLPFHGTYVNIEGWSRRTYLPPGLPGDAPVVWMFGGSTTWGEGQRDEYTIASYIARAAKRDRMPIRVVNYGQRGWTHFQEMILFEQLLVASEPKPVLALFYDGANEINAQTLGAKGVPTHTLADQYATTLSGGHLGDGFTSPSSPWSSLAVIWDEYTTHSAVRKLVGRLQDVIDPPAGAAVLSGDDDKPAGTGQTYVKTIEDAQDAVEVYERGRRMTEHLAEDRHVDPVFFWQPVKAGPAEVWANANITAPTVNISDALDEHEDVFIDGGHTNEEGARIVAERIWREVAPKVRRLGRN